MNCKKTLLKLIPTISVSTLNAFFCDKMMGYYHEHRKNLNELKIRLSFLLLCLFHNQIPQNMMKCPMAKFLAIEQSSLYSLVFLISQISSNLSQSPGLSTCAYSFALRSHRLNLEALSLTILTGQSEPCQLL